MDGYPRPAYSDALDDKTAATALAFWNRACAPFAGDGITVERLLTDNGSACTSHASRREHAALGINDSRNSRSPAADERRGQTPHRTLLEEWAYKRLHTSGPARL